ncbi:ATP-grasp domain-containing protein [Vibrio sp. Of14-4]|uniref:ATP-grasp domain-containing protein n=1 Tax=Vibrio sp. Of14-4 TaxID=2724878 RepID=UPI001EF3CE3A|nr:ATP-grasp domain-containing protein [Vibrio sp. Of14-4]MCG7487911.1 ATP-grasp domain-containing protein [Vibrio sp. Of14-4]
MKPTIIIVTHVVNDAVTHGFVPTAKAMGLEVILITDHKFNHLKLSENDKRFSPDEILECDVFNPLELIETITNQELQPNAIFSNSDHLQTSTAICAQFFCVPAKDWKVTLKAKNKYLTRQVLNEKLLPNIASQLLYSGSAPKLDFPFPVVAKPKEGVASIDVQRCNSQSELEIYCEHFWQKHPTNPILVEAFLEGTVISVETLGDGENITALGGFDVELAEPPFFIETAATWNGPLSVEFRDECVRQLKEFGVGLGVCHSEFIITESGPVLVEINYRSVGDGKEFLLDNLTQGNWFSTILNLHLGKELDSEFQMNGSANVHYVVADQSGIIEGNSTSFLEREDDIVIQQQVLKKVGENFTQSFSNKDYLARISVVSPSGENLEPTLQKTISQFDLKAASEVTA